MLPFSHISIYKQLNLRNCHIYQEDTLCQYIKTYLLLQINQYIPYENYFFFRTTLLFIRY